MHTNQRMRITAGKASSAASAKRRTGLGWRARPGKRSGVNGSSSGCESLDGKLNNIHFRAVSYVCRAENPLDVRLDDYTVLR